MRVERMKARGDEHDKRRGKQTVESLVMSCGDSGKVAAEGAKEDLSSQDSIVVVGAQNDVELGGWMRGVGGADPNACPHSDDHGEDGRRHVGDCPTDQDRQYRDSSHDSKTRVEREFRS